MLTANVTTNAKIIGFEDLDELRTRFIVAQGKNLEGAAKAGPMVPLKAALCAAAWAYGRIKRDLAAGRDPKVVEPQLAFVRERIMLAFGFDAAYRPVAAEACTCFLAHLDHIGSCNMVSVTYAYWHVKSVVLARIDKKREADAKRPQAPKLVEARAPLTVETVRQEFEAAPVHGKKSKLQWLIKRIAAEQHVLPNDRDLLYAEVRMLYTTKVLPPITSADESRERLAATMKWFQDQLPKPQPRKPARPSGRSVYVAPVFTTTPVVETSPEPAVPTSEAARLSKLEYQLQINERQKAKEVNRKANEEAAKAAEARRAHEAANRKPKAPKEPSKKEGKKESKRDKR